MATNTAPQPPASAILNYM